MTAQELINKLQQLTEKQKNYLIIVNTLDEKLSHIAIVENTDIIKYYGSGIIALVAE